MLSLEQLFLNNNNLNRVWYPDCGKLDEQHNGCESLESFRPFTSLHSLSLGTIMELTVQSFYTWYICMLEELADWLLFSGGNNIEDLESVDSLNCFPNLMVSTTFVNKIIFKSCAISEMKWSIKTINFSKIPSKIWVLDQNIAFSSYLLTVLTRVYKTKMTSGPGL